MKSICFFSSYYNTPEIPYYVRCYLRELVNHFEKIVLLTNEKPLTDHDRLFLEQEKIEWMLVVNEGYDFGMWYKAFKEFPVSDYDRIGLVNDSCILFKKLDSFFLDPKVAQLDYCGILDSIEKGYHLQTFLTIINKNAIAIVTDYFIKHGLVIEFEEVIDVYEVGLSQHLIRNNLKVGALFNYDVKNPDLNASFSGIKKLIEMGFPMIKKKIIFGSYREGELKHLSNNSFDFNISHYIKLIRENVDKPLIDFEVLKKEYNYNKVKYRILLISTYWRYYFIFRKILSAVYRRLFK